MALSELVSAKSSLDRMNKGSITLDEILMQQRNEKQKTGLGFNPESSTYMQSGKSIFVKGPALYSGILATVRSVTLLGQLGPIAGPWTDLFCYYYN